MTIPEIQLATFCTTDNNIGIIRMYYYSSNSIIRWLKLSHKISRLRAVHPYDILPYYVQISEKNILVLPNTNIWYMLMNRLKGEETDRLTLRRWKTVDVDQLYFRRLFFLLLNRPHQNAQIPFFFFLSTYLFYTNWISVLFRMQFVCSPFFVFFCLLYSASNL